MAAFKRDFEFNPEIIRTVAINIRKYRKLKGLTQEQVAIDIEVSPEFYRKFESTQGSEGISLRNVYRISVVLETRIDKFFEKVDESEYRIKK